MNHSLAVLILASASALAHAESRFVTVIIDGPNGRCFQGAVLTDGDWVVPLPGEKPRCMLASRKAPTARKAPGPWTDFIESEAGKARVR